MLDLSYKKLDVYQIALNLLTKIYQLTRHFPKEEQFAMFASCAERLFLFAVISKKERPGIQSLKNIDFLKFHEAVR